MLLATILGRLSRRKEPQLPCSRLVVEVPASGEIRVTQTKLGMR